MGCYETAIVTRVLYCGGPSVGEVADCVDRLEKSERYGNDCQQKTQRVRSCDEGEVSDKAAAENANRGYGQRFRLNVNGHSPCFGSSYWLCGPMKILEEIHNDAVSVRRGIVYGIIVLTK